jgi:TetR/AcrR family transcriptional regulator
MSAASARDSKSRATRRPGRPAAARAGAAREALLRAARELLTEKGLPAVTVREIAERAGVQPALVNYHFGGKDALLRSVLASVSEEMAQRIREVTTGRGSIEERVRELLHGLVEALTANPYAPRLMVEQVLFADESVIDDFVDGFARPNLDAIHELLDDGLDSGVLRRVDSRFLVPFMFGSCLYLFLNAPLLRRLYGIDEIDTDLAREYADRFAELVMHGIAAPRDASS